ncbi:MAG: hypothetical protein AB7O97_06030 [Planctomycetota bacterium]
MPLRRSVFVACAAIASSSLTLGQIAVTAAFGSGCYQQRQSFYELFPTGTFDLAGTATQASGFSMISFGNGYVVLPLLGAWHVDSPAAQVLQLGDDQITTPLPLGFQVPYPGGGASSIQVGSNGSIYLESSFDQSFSPSTSALLAGEARIVPFWTDLNPNSGGAVTLDLTAGAAFVTFTNVPEFPATGSNTFQVALHASGQVDLLYRGCSNVAHPVLVGWSPGRGARDPGGDDLSTRVPSTFVTGPDVDPLTLEGIGRPVMGTTMLLRTSGFPGPIGALLVIGTTQFAQGVDLVGIGMSGCRQYTDLAMVVGVPGTGTTATLPLAVPSAPVFLGLAVFAQSLALGPGLNPLGLVTSNGVALTVGS